MDNVARVILNSYQEVPEQIALNLLYNRSASQSLTYRDFVLGAASYSKALERAGVRPGQVVILILDHGLDLVTSFFGAILHGAIPSIMPFLTEKLDPEHYRSSLASLFEITAPEAVVTSPAFLSEVKPAASPVKSIRAVLDCSQVEPATSLEGSSLHGLSRAPGDILLLQHSSGTTGLQKGVALSHEAVSNQLEAYGRALHLGSQDVVASWLPLYHDMGLIAGFLLPLLKRVPLVLMSPFDWVQAPYKLFQAVSRYRGTLTWLPNFAYNFCAKKIRARDLEGVDLSSWRAVINCSEPMDWHSHQIFLERFRPYGLQPQALATCYAMAENVFAVTQGGIDAPVVVDRVDRAVLLAQQQALPTTDENESLLLLSTGRPVDGVAVRVLDPAGQDLPERQIGEIALRSHCMLTGYYNRPDLTGKAFLDGWFLTGDLGYLAGSELYVTGRKKDLMIVGGKNIYPQDIERLASEASGVHPGRVVAFGMYNEETGTEEVVVVAETDLENPDENSEAFALADEIRNCVTRGSDIALRYVKITGRGWLLKTSSGKIARVANREKYLSE